MSPSPAGVLPVGLATLKHKCTNRDDSTCKPLASSATTENEPNPTRKISVGAASPASPNRDKVRKGATMTPSDGGPAFPVDMQFDDVRVRSTGQSLRDWFAGMALQGMLANDEMVQAVKRTAKDDCKFAQVLAASAFDVAETMLAERAKGGE